MTTESEQGCLPLPGLDAVPTLDGQTPARPVSDLEVAIRRTIAELHRQGHVVEVDAGKLQLALELSQVIAMKKATRRASTIGHDAKVLLDILDSIVEEATDVDDTLRDAMREWSDYAAGGSAPAPVEP